MKLLLICEGSADEEDLKALTLRVLHEQHAWMMGLEGLDEPTPCWLEYEPGRGFLQWSHINQVCDNHHVPRVQQLGRGLDFCAALRAFRLLSNLPTLDLADGVRVILVHDSDHNEGWRERLEAAREEWLSGLRAEEQSRAMTPRDIGGAIGVAHPEHEAWVIAAFEPEDEADRERLESLRRHFGSDPRTHGHELTSSRGSHPKDAKKTLETLCPEEGRRSLLLKAVPLEVLRSRGEQIGLTAFLEDLRHHVADAFGPPSEPT